MHLLCGSFRLDLSRPRVMGIINATPDSFSDGGKFMLRDTAVAHAEQLIGEGADILDIGGESTRPGAQPVGIQQELDRVMPVIEALQGAPVPLSIDTHKPEVMQVALAAGAHMVNDINALQDALAMKLLSGSQAAVCLMHKQGEPQSMQTQPKYRDVVGEVMDFLAARVQAAETAGIARDRIVIDPGFGFGKTLAHNLELLQGLRRFTGLGVPVLAGLSRKSMLGALTGRELGERMPASIVAALLAAQRGAAIVRVHDVRETVDALKVWSIVNS